MKRKRVDIPHPGYEYSLHMTASPFINPHLHRVTSALGNANQTSSQTPRTTDDTTPGSSIHPQLSCHYTAEEVPGCNLKVSATSFRPIDTPVSTRLPLKSTSAIRTPIPSVKVQSKLDKTPSTTTIRLISPPPISRVITQKELLQEGAPKIPTCHSRVPSQTKVTKIESVFKPTDRQAPLASPKTLKHQPNTAARPEGALVTTTKPSPTPRQSISAKLSEKLYKVNDSQERVKA